MGLLDDAIRQHLELKRQHGAPEDEIERQEEEALGPARRDVAPAEPTGGNGEVELETPDESPAAEAASEQETELFEPEDREPELAELDQPEAAEDEPDEAGGAFDEPEREVAIGPDTPFEPDAPFEPDDPVRAFLRAGRALRARRRAGERVRRRYRARRRPPARRPAPVTRPLRRRHRLRGLRPAGRA